MEQRMENYPIITHPYRQKLLPIYRANIFTYYIMELIQKLFDAVEQHSMMNLSHYYEVGDIRYFVVALLKLQFETIPFMSTSLLKNNHFGEYFREIIFGTSINLLINLQKAGVLLDPKNETKSYKLLLPPAKSSLNFPNARLVAEKIFHRTQFKPTQINAGLCDISITQFLIENAVKSHRSPINKYCEYNDKKYQYQEINKEVHGKHIYYIKMIYGYENEELSAIVNKIIVDEDTGLFKTKLVNNIDYPICVKDTDQETQTILKNKGYSRDTIISHTNRDTIFLNFWIRFFINLHNNICKQLPHHLNGRKKYEIAKKFTNLLYVKIVWERVICNIFSHIKKYMKGFLKEGFALNFIETPEMQNHLFEFNLAYRWHCFIPDEITFDNKLYNASEMNKFNKECIFTIHQELNKNHPGEVTFQNNPSFLSNIHIRDNIYMDVDVAAIEQARAIGVPMFNDYQQLFGMPKYKSFIELCGDNKLAKDLSTLYDTVDDVEFYIGIHVEQPELLGEKRGLGSRMMKSIIFVDALVGTINAYKKYTDWKTKNEFNINEDIFTQIMDLDVDKLFLKEQQMEVLHFLNNIEHF